MYLSIDLPKLCLLIYIKHQEEMMSFCNSVDGMCHPACGRFGSDLQIMTAITDITNVNALDNSKPTEL